MKFILSCGRINDKIAPLKELLTRFGRRRGSYFKNAHKYMPEVMSYYLVVFRRWI
jgi:hypothetical protein